MELWRDSGHFKRFGYSVGKSEDSYSNSSGEGVFGDVKYYYFDSDSDFVVVERFEYGVAFGGG